MLTRKCYDRIMASHPVPTLYLCRLYHQIGVPLSTFFGPPGACLDSYLGGGCLIDLGCRVLVHVSTISIS